MSIYDYTVKDRKGNDIPMSEFKGKVLLIVNTATGCGFTPQYEGIEKIYEAYHNQGFEVLDFPCNQFGNQAHEFCTFKYKTQFDQLKKIDVNGENQDPLWAYLKEQKGFEGFDLKGKILIPIVKKMDPNYKTSSDIKWNFTKFLVDREGNVVERFESTVAPEKIENKVKELIEN